MADKENLRTALMCQLPRGKAGDVVLALHRQKAHLGSNKTNYVLAEEVEIFGLKVKKIVVNPSDDESPDSYTAIFADTTLKKVATAAQLKPLAGGYIRDTEHGRLSADIRDRKNIHLTCTVTQ